MQMSHRRHVAIAARLTLGFHPKNNVTEATTRSMNLAGKQRHSSNHPLNESGTKSCLNATVQRANMAVFSRLICVLVFAAIASSASASQPPDVDQQAPPALPDFPSEGDGRVREFHRAAVSLHMPLVG